MFHRDQSWPLFYITSIPMTCRHQSCRNMHMQTSLPLSILLETGRPLKVLLAKNGVAAFHLNNREAGRKLTVTPDGKCLFFTKIPTYLGVKLKRLLTYYQHIESLRLKLTSHVAFMRVLAGLGWGASAAVLRTTALALVYSTAEHWHLSGIAVYTPTLLTPALSTPTSSTQQLMMHSA